MRRGPRGLLVAGLAAPAALVALVALLGLTAPAAPAAPPGAASARPRHVVIAAVPGVTWEDVAAGRAPVLRSLGERWSMAALSIRTAVSPTDAASAMTTIGAGNRARGRTAADNRGLHFGAVPGALANAIYNACGVRIREHPITRDKIMAGLKAQGRRA